MQPAGIAKYCAGKKRCGYLQDGDVGLRGRPDQLRWIMSFVREDDFNGLCVEYHMGIRDDIPLWAENDAAANIGGCDNRGNGLGTDSGNRAAMAQETPRGGGGNFADCFDNADSLDLDDRVFKTMVNSSENPGEILRVNRRRLIFHCRARRRAERCCAAVKCCPRHYHNGEEESGIPQAPDFIFSKTSGPKTIFLTTRP